MHPVKDLLRYDKMVEEALRGVVRDALARAAAHGLPGAHHFYITFRTHFPALSIPDHLSTKYPEEMTIVLEHQFWDLEVRDERFSVTLSFQNRPERLEIPFAAITAFADPAVKFALQFQPPADEEKSVSVLAAPAPDAGEKSNKACQVVTLDTFRKK